jgi:hypothetical protein
MAAEAGEPSRIKVVGHHQPRWPHPRRDLQGFAARCGTEIQHPFPRLGIQSGHRRHGDRFLHVVPARSVGQRGAGLDQTVAGIAPG